MPILAFGDTVTVTRQTFNSFGEAIEGASHDISACAVWPTATSEVVDGQETVTWTLTVLMPEGSDILATDAVMVNGTVYAVNGEPALFRSPLTNTTAGIQVLLKTATG